MNELIKVEKLNPVEIFTKDGIKPVIDEIKKKVAEFVPDMTTAKGRDEIRSMASNVAKSKTCLEKLALALTADWNAKVNLVNESRRLFKDELDELKAKVRQPLTNWENEEKERVAMFEDKIIRISQYAFIDTSDSLNTLKIKQGQLSTLVIDDSWREFQFKAKSEKEKSLSALKNRIDELEKYEAKQVELKKLREEKEKRDKEEYERKLKEEAAAKARKEAEEEARIERERIEKDKKDAERREQVAREKAVIAEKNKLMADEKAKQEKKEAQEQAKKLAKENEERRLLAEKKSIQDKKDAEEIARRMERERIENVKKIAEEKERKRRADIVHRKDIEQKIVSTVAQKLGTLTLIEIEQIIDLIANEEIPHITINY